MSNYSMTLVNVPEEDIRAFDSLMREMNFENREALLAIMTMTFQAIRERTKERDQLGFMDTRGNFTTFDIHNMNVGHESAFLLLPYPPAKPSGV